MEDSQDNDLPRFLTVINAERKALDQPLADVAMNFGKTLGIRRDLIENILNRARESGAESSLSLFVPIRGLVELSASRASKDDGQCHF